MTSCVVRPIQHPRGSALRSNKLALFPLILLAACGGGGGGDGGSTSASAAPVGAAPTGSVNVLYSGPVTGIGSIVVNGVRFETVGAKVHDADEPYGAASYPGQIKLGMTVSVEGSADDAQGSGAASNIRIDGGARGQVSAIDTGANTLTVNGQAIKVDGATTVFQGVSGLSGLSTSTWVEVYGLPQSDGTILATRIEAYSSQSALAAIYAGASTYPVSLRGVVESSAANSLTLSSGSGKTIAVSYRDADVMPAGASTAAGSDVRILALAASDPSAVTAAKVLVLSPASQLAQSTASGGVSVKLKGAVDSVNGDTIVVSGTTVDLSNATLPGGAPSVGEMVEVKGTLGNDTLVAGKLEFGDRETSYTSQPGGASVALSYHQELYGTISGYTAGSDTFTVQGVAVKVDANTRYEYGYSTLADNVYVEVKGTLNNGALLASKIDVKGATAGGASASSDSSAKSGNSEQHSSGGASFEVYGTLSCTAYPGNCTIAVSTGGSVAANLSNAAWSAEHGGFVADTPLSVEAKGVLDNAGVYQVAKIERKA